MRQLDRIKLAISTARPRSSISLYAGLTFGFWLNGVPALVALGQALPMLVICLAGFTINDIFDQETDRINHPDRALAQYPALSGPATTIYALLFVLAIVLILWQQDPLMKSVWALSFLLISNYNFLKKHLPAAKNLYMVLCTCVVVSTIDLSNDGNTVDLANYLPIGLSVFARELACDIHDIDGDGPTIAKLLGAWQSYCFVFILYFASLTLMLSWAITPIQVQFASLGVLCLLGYGFALWRPENLEKSQAALTGILVATPVALLVS